MNHAALFNGIGGFQLAAEWMGWNNHMSCEIDNFCNRVTKYHFPNCIQHNDIRTTDFTIYKGRISILTGGFPCQPYSVAGLQQGTEDDRHLWPEMLRAVREIEPEWVTGENVPGLVNWNGGLVFEQVQTDLENQGYEVQTFILPAASVQAPHERSRVWFIAKNTNKNGRRSEQREEEPCERRQWNIGAGNNERILPNNGKVRANTDTYSERGRSGNNKWEYATNVDSYGKENGFTGYFDGWPTQPPLCFRDDGISDKLDGITFPSFRRESIKGAGNAIVPQVALQIFKAIEQYNNLINKG